MDWSPVVMECLVEERLAEARAAAAQRGLLRSLPPSGQSQGPTLRARLAEIGQRLLGSGRVEAPASATVKPERVVTGSPPPPMSRREDCEERAA